MRQAAFPALMAGAVAMLAVVLVTTVLAHRFVQPIRQLGDRAAAIARGDFQPVAVWRHDDEIRDLALSINRMAEQLGQYEVQIRRHEQLRTLDRLGAGMAHQLRNAATGGRMAIELHRRQCGAGPADESLEVALRQLRLMESYLQRFMALGRDQPKTARSFSLATVVEDALSLVRPACAHAGIDLEFVPPQRPLWVRGDPDALRQLTVNLTLNAVEAAGRQNGSQPRITVALECLGQERRCTCGTQVRDHRRRLPIACSSPLSAENRKAPVWGSMWPGRWPRTITARSVGGATPAKPTLPWNCRSKKKEWGEKDETRPRSSRRIPRHADCFTSSDPEP